MAKLVVKEAGLYDHIEYDERGFPRKGIPMTLTMEGNDFDKTLLLRVSGEPGAYWLTIEAEAAEPNRLSASFPNEHIIIPKDGDAWITVDIPIKDPPVGRFSLRVLLAGQRLATVNFEIAAKS